MFTGAIPKPCVEQAIKIAGIGRDDEVYICCSGSFRLEQALTALGIGRARRSNDVSLLSVTLGRHLMGERSEFKFVRALAPIEDAVSGGSPLERMAGIGLALELAKYKGASEHAKAHTAHLLGNAEAYIRRGAERVAKYLERIQIHDFFSGDFRDHAKQAIARGATIVAWPPTYKGGYERLYKHLHSNVEWEPPSYRMFDPKDLAGWLEELDASGARYCVCADHPLEGREASAIYESGRNKPVFLYASKAVGSSVRKVHSQSFPVKYDVVTATDLTRNATVELVPVSTPVMNFVKDRFLKLGLVHADGMMRFLVMVNRKLAGGFIYKRDTMAGAIDVVYLLCDFAVTNETKLSKLVAMLATGKEAIGKWDRARVQRTEHVFTTAFTDKPVSMKYRGVYELVSRKPGMLNYKSEVRQQSNAEIYRDWLKRYAAK